jgi:molybdopterin/thiamine biosynthesis adenylyltransferase/nitroreductase
LRLSLFDVCHDVLNQFVYETAFDRNIGWTTEGEQQALRRKRVAIAGMGGVGGVHLLTLARTGIGAFSIADMDRFDLPNMNRQVGAMMSTIGEPKVDVLARMARDINPELRINCFPAGVQAETIDGFLEDADLFVDGLDFFALDMRRKIFARCAELGIPAITAAPIGMGTGYLIFRPGGMSFERYFGLAGQNDREQYLRFLMGVAPRGLARAYLVDPSRVDLARQRGPSTAASCQLCAGVVAAEAIKILLGRGRVRWAPFHQHFDAYRGQLAVSWLPFGAAGPIQSVKRAIARRVYGAMALRAPAVPPSPPSDAIEAILSLARWTPSGDNAQPWRFRRCVADLVTIDIAIDRSNVYEYRDGEPTLLSAGMLLESIRLAASLWRRRIAWTHEFQTGAGGSPIHRITVRFTPDDAVSADPLASVLTTRSVDRRAYRLRRLSVQEKQRLADCLDSDLVMTWHETWRDRLRLSRLGAAATDIRLRMRETFAIHNAVVDWRAGPSKTGIPAAALGLPWPTLKLMRWAARDWRRMNWLNRLGGAATAMVQMDIAPGLQSAGFFSVRFAVPDTPHTVDAILRAGERLQRLWLTADRMGLAMHPALATIAFAHYGSVRAPFTADTRLRPKATALAKGVETAIGPVRDLIFIARIGEPYRHMVRARSVRRDLAELLEGKVVDPA